MLDTVVLLASRLTEPVGGTVQPFVVSTSTDARALELARTEQERTDAALKRAGQDVETDLRIDRSVAAGLNRAALQAESSLLLLPWRGRRDVLTALLGASYSEIVAATSVPVAIAAIHFSCS